MTKGHRSGHPSPPRRGAGGEVNLFHPSPEVEGQVIAGMMMIAMHCIYELIIRLFFKRPGEMNMSSKN